MTGQDESEGGPGPIEDRLRCAGVPGRFLDCSLSNYLASTSEQHGVLDWAQAYATQTHERPRSAVLLGSVGTGKTHVGVGIARVYLEQTEPLWSQHEARWVETVHYTTVLDAINRVKYSWDGNGSSKDAHEALTRPRLLILDEVGMQGDSKFNHDLLFSAINHRYGEMKPTILISNLTLSEFRDFMGERAMDRLREDGGEVQVFDWPSHRRKAQ